jgi:hypothetical protein
MLRGMSNGVEPVALPMRFAGVDVLVQVAQVRVVGSEPTSAVDRLADMYDKAELTIVNVARSVAGTIGKLAGHGRHPSQVEVKFGLSVSTEGKIIVVGGEVEANLQITLTYEGAAGGEAGG